MGNKALDYTALTIALIGAVNWGLVGFFNFNLVSWIFGTASWVTRIIYALVGLCGLYLITFYSHSGREAEKEQGRAMGVLSFSFGGFCFIPLAFSIFFLTQTNLFCGYSRHIFLAYSEIP